MQTVIPTFIGLLTLMLCMQLAVAQSVPNVDKSPADISYMRSGGEVVAKVLYGRPSVNEREIFGKLVKYGKVWRTGANEATEIKFYRNVSIGDETVNAGTYTLFTIPGEENWTIILNSQLDQWGAYRYDESKDALRVEVPVGSSEKTVESFAIYFRDTQEGGEMIIAWDTTMVSVPIQF